MHGIGRRTALGGLALLSGVVTSFLIARAYVPRQQARAVAGWQARLSAMADDRARFLSLWTEHGLADAALAASLREVIATVQGDAGSRGLERIRPSLAVVLAGHGALAVLDENGRILRTTPWVSPDPGLVDDLVGPVPGCLRPSVELRVGAARRVVAFTAPIRNTAGARIGGVLLIDDVQETLLAALRTGSMAASSAETLLVGRAGADIVFLTPLRHAPPGTSLRLPATTRELAAADAIRGVRGFGRYVDYRGVPVLAATRRVEGTDWGLVVKVDEEEALGPIRREAWIVASAAAFGLLLLGVAAYSWDRHQRVALDGERTRGESERMRLLENANDGILFREPGGRILDFNARFAEMLGYPRDQLVGRQSRELRTAEERQRWDATSQRLMTDRRAVFETEVLHHDGRVVPVEVSSQLAERNGQQIVVSVIRDISERRRAREALDSLHRLLGSVIEGTTDAVFVKDREGRYLVVNETIVRLLGQPRDQILGNLDAALFPPRVAETFRRSDERAISRGAVETVEEEAVFASGDIRTMLTTKGPLLDGGGAVVGVFGVSRDITGLKEVERELRDATARMQLQVAALDAASNAIVITDAGGTITWVNQAFERLTGYTRSEALGQTPRILRSGTQEADFYARMWRDILAGQVWRGEIVNRRKDGSLYPEEMTITPVRGDDGTITHFIAIKQDISDRRSVQAALVQATDQLRQAQKMEAVGRLAGGVAHDFNNLLGVILGNGESVLSELSPGGSSHEAVSDMVTAAKRGASLTRQLLAFSRRQAIQPRVIDLDLVVSGLERMLGRVIGEDVDLDLRLRAGARKVLADPGQVEQVVMNLVVNSRDAMPAGGRIVIATRHVEVAAGRIDGVAPGPHVELSVSDTGSGMDGATLQRIFEPFFTTKPPGTGTGLGLATVYGIAKQNGGFVEVESAPGHGARFRVCFPAAPEAAEVAPISAGGAAVSPSQATVLVVEDQDPLRRVVVRQLARRGYQVLAAALPAEALRIVRDHPSAIDLVLTDVVMPQMSGPDLVDRLKDVRPGLGVLFMSGYTSDVLVRKGVDAHGIEILEKPFSADALAGKVESALARRCRPPTSAPAAAPADAQPATCGFAGD